MLKNLAQFKSVIQGMENTFHFEQGCPISIAKESLFECLKWLGQIEDQARAAKEASDKSSPPESTEELKEK